MKIRLSIATLSVLGCLFTVTQSLAEQAKSSSALDTIQKLQNSGSKKLNEISVTLDPVGQAPASLIEESKPVLVTGKSPEQATPAAEQARPPAAEQARPPAIPTEPDAPKPENELAVRVEKLHAGKGVIDPNRVQLRAPFPAKPLAQAPAGWRLDASDSAPPFTREVEISPGSKIPLIIRPHLLIPDADGAQVFTISEPGYESSLGYHQTATVGAILSNSIRQLDDESKQLGTAIDNLQQLLVSLPKPEPMPEPEPQPEFKPEFKPSMNRKR